MTRDQPDYIVVEGPIGVGKTTLARRLARTFETSLMLEQAAENPFLPRFYADPRALALPTQLCFLLQRARQLEALRQTDLFKPVQVADFLIAKDRLFAEATLDDDELALYLQVYERLALDAPAPDLVIYLQAPVDVLLERVIKRGHDYERPLDRGYLGKIASAYIEFFYHYNDSPLLIVNTNDFDLATNDDHYELLLGQIRRHAPGRHYFNPAGP